MYEIRRDAAKNRVYVTLAGQIEIEEVNEAAAEVSEALAASQTGSRCCRTSRRSNR